jgi:hypothetical protein
MTRMRLEINVADLLRAFDALKPRDDAQRRAIAALLGFDWQAASESEVEVRRDRRRRPSPAPPAIQHVHRAEPPPKPPANYPKRDSAAGIRISPPRRAALPALDWFGAAGPSETLQVGTLQPAHDPPPLFRPQWTRAILSASLAARVPIGPPDIARAVEAVARGEMLRVLPRQPILTLAGGVQALIDVGEAMQPFWHDRAVLRHDLMRIVGRGIEILECAGTPGQTRRDDDALEWADYETRFLPRLGASVLIVSDFGIGRAALVRRASPRSWARLARKLARSSHRVVGFVPYPPARFPAELARAMHLVSWDRTTTAGRISFSRRRRLA